MRTIEELLQEAKEVQDACNLSGVVHSFSRGMDDLWKIAREEGQGTIWVNTHEYSKLFASKIMSLTGEWL